MATVREGKQTALVVVDVQVGVVADAWEAPRVIQNVARAVERARAQEAELAQRQVAHIVLAGAATNWCIRATAYAALERGYDLTLVKDAHTTETMVMDDGMRVEAAQVVQDLNLAMTWLSYPGRRNATAAAASVDFSSAATGS